MKVRSEIYNSEADRFLRVSNTGKFHQVKVDIYNSEETQSICVDGPTLIKAIQNAMND